MGPVATSRRPPGGGRSWRVRSEASRRWRRCGSPDDTLAVSGQPTVAHRVKREHGGECEEGSGPVRSVIPFDTRRRYPRGQRQPVRPGRGGVDKDIHRGGTGWRGARQRTGPCDQTRYGWWAGRSVRRVTAARAGRENGIEDVKRYPGPKPLVGADRGTRDPFTSVSASTVASWVHTSQPDGGNEVAAPMARHTAAHRAERATWISGPAQQTRPGLFVRYERLRQPAGVSRRTRQSPTLRGHSRALAQIRPC